VAVAEKELIVRHVGDDDAPWVDTGMGVELKLMRYDSDRGTWTIRNRFAPGVQLQRHRHTGPVEGYTLSGRWHYLEYDFVSAAGSYIYEPANSVHTLHVPEDNTGPTDVLFVIEGALLNLNDDDTVDNVFDGPAFVEVYFAMLEGAGLPRPNGLVLR
jgi:2,4'-dihydroxyacetophenone dioxygenase